METESAVTAPAPRDRAVEPPFVHDDACCVFEGNAARYLRLRL